VRRIFPALILVLVACLVVGWFTLFSVEYTQLGKHVAGSAGFVSNFLFWNEAGYFDKSAETKPLLHIWSLGVEEQFYIVWPLLLYLTWKRKIGSLTLIMVLLVSSFVLNVRTIGSDVAADYYSPLTRFWELLAGAILAYLAFYKPGPANNFSQPLRWVGLIGPTDTLGPTINNLKAAGGLLLVTAAVLLLDQTRGYPSWRALLPVIGTYLMLSAGPLAWINHRLLASRMLVAIGLISYPLYLWHWPLLSFERIIEGQNPSAETAGLAILSCFVLASITYFLVEKPIRLGRLPPAKTFLPLLTTMSVIGFAGYYVYGEQGFSFREKAIEDIIASVKDFDFRLPGAGNGDTIDTLTYDAFVIGTRGADETVLVGDSTMQQYIPRARRLAEQHMIDLDHNRIVLTFSSGCPPIPDIAIDIAPVCAEAMDKILPLLNGRAVKTVAFAALWTNQFKYAPFYLRSDGPNNLLMNSDLAREHAFRNFGDLIFQLTRSGKRVFVLLETPVFQGFDPSGMLATGWGRLLGKPNIPNDPRRVDIEKYNGEIDRRVKTVAEAAGAPVISPMDYLCNKETCPIFGHDGHLMYYNWDHLRASFVSEHAIWIDQIFNVVTDPATTRGGSHAQ
jgi:peptidoglycan/LPS O-acetylase OafA/YrhL